MSKTELLPPITAVCLVWALTGKFSDDDHSQKLALYAEDTLKHIEDQAQTKGASPQERSYVTAAVATMKSSLRSLDTAYKGRTLNFQENAKLREFYLESVKESLDFGSDVKDFLKSLPTMIIGAAGGVTVIQALFPFISESGVAIWGIGLAFAAAGYLVNVWFKQNASKQKQLRYVLQDYERGLYYEQYVTRVKRTLVRLFLDLERIHKRVFKENYENEIDPDARSEMINKILAGVDTTWCKYVHDHMDRGLVTAEHWTRCESGNDQAIRHCPHWEGGRA